MRRPLIASLFLALLVGMPSWSVAGGRFCRRQCCCVPPMPPPECSPPAPVSPEAALRQVLDGQVAAWNRGDLEGFMAGYWHSTELTFQSGATVTRGWQATLDRYRSRYQGEGKEMGHLTFSDLEIQVLAADSAMVRGRWKVVKSKETAGGLFTLILKRFPEGWRIVHDHTS